MRGTQLVNWRGRQFEKRNTRDNKIFPVVIKLEADDNIQGDKSETRNIKKQQ